MELPISIENVKILLGARPKDVPVIPTASSRKRSITGILNSIAQSEPAYLPAIRALTVYPLMRWVLDVRSAAPAGMAEAEPFLEKGPLGSRRDECFALYGQVCRMIEEAVEKLAEEPVNGTKYRRAVADVHLSGSEGKPVSIYQLNTHYRHAVERLCAFCGSRAAELTEQLDECVGMDYSFSEEMANPAFEAAKRLISAYPDGSRSLRKALKYASDSLASHPKDGKQMKDVLSAILNGATTVDSLQKAVGLAWNTIARYRAEAYNAIGYLFWGYSCSEMIFWLWEAQIEEQGSV